jgi:signal transduction histidine kinase
MPPTARQQRVAFCAVGVLVAGLLVALPYAGLQLRELPAFVVITDTMLFLLGLITAALLFVQFSIARSRALLALSVGYLFCALLAVPHLLTFPGVFSPAGLLGASLQSTVWLYLFFQLGLPVAVIAYALIKGGDRETIAPGLPSGIIIFASVAASVAAAIAITLLVTAGGELMPRIMATSLRAAPGWSDTMAGVILLVTSVAIALVWRNRSSAFDLWLIAALCALFVEAIFLGLAHSRYSLMWYAGRTYVLLSLSFLMLMLLAESTRLYTRLAVSLAARDREREHKRMTLEVVVDAIAHELNQPLCAIVANGDAAVGFLKQVPPNIAEACAALDDIAVDGERASRVITSTRAVLMGSPTESDWIKVDTLLGEALMLLRWELRSHEVAPEFEAAGNLPAVRGNKSQLLQLFVNLLTNAVESMSAVTTRARELRIRASLQEPAFVAICIEDSGVGIAPENSARIFEPFFTTKPNRTGLGLALCRMIVETHGGEISVSNGERFGSAFRVVLPAGS